MVRISLVYTNNVNTLGGSTQTVQKNIQTLVFAVKKNGLEVNTDKISHVSRPKSRKKSHHKYT
jgi:hypothetical protein